MRLTGGNDITPEVKAFMARYGVRGYPTLYVMNADGHVVVPKVGRTVDGMLEALANGEKAEASFAEARKKSDPEGRKALAGILKDRMAWDELATIQEEALKAAPTADAYAELAATYASAARPADEKAMLTKAVERYPDAKDRTKWRIRLAIMDTDPSKASNRDEYVALATAAVKPLSALAAKIGSEKDKSGVPQVENSIGGMLLSAGKADDAEKHFDTALAADAKGATAPAAMMGKANCAFSRKDWAGCKAHLEKIVAEFPESEEAKQAPRGIANCQKQIDAGK